MEEASAAQRVFAIPELLEPILLQLDLHTNGRYRVSHVAHAIQLCRLEQVSTAFGATLRAASKLRMAKELLHLDDSPREHAAVIWLLRELGHHDFTRASCEAFGCSALGGKHICGGAGIEVGRSLEIPTYEYRLQFRETVGRLYATPTGYMPPDRSWRSLKIMKPLVIYYKSRTGERRRVVSHEDTLGGLWDAHASKL